MNRYHDAMELCGPPPELENRLREAVLSAEPGPQARPAVFRPRGFFRKAALAAVLAVALTLSVGAAVLVNWDDIFTDYFGPGAAETPMAAKAFQEVNISSVCDDVTLTLRQALVDEKNLYLILDYQLPDTVDREAVAMAYESEDRQVNGIGLPDISYYLTGDVSWEDLKAADQGMWADIDWTDPNAYISYVGREKALMGSALAKHTSGTTGGSESQGYDMEANTLTYLFRIAVESGSVDFTAQPVTVLLTPPVLRVDGVNTAVTDHPALVTFRPTGGSQTLTASYQQDGTSIQVVLSPFTISLHLTGNTTYLDMEELISDTSLVLTDGSTLPVRGLNRSGGYSGHTSRKQGEEFPFSLSFSGSFRDLLDVSQVAAIQVGGMTVPLA